MSNWPKFCLLFAALAAVSGASAPSALPGLVKSYRSSPTPEGKSQLSNFAKEHANDRLAQFALGMTGFGQKDYAEAVTHLKAAQPSLPKLADYVSFYIASALVEMNDYQGAVKELAFFHKVSSPLSPLAAKATLLEAQALVHTQAFEGAIRLLRQEFDGLPQPDANSALAQAYEGKGDLAQAAVLYQSVYFMHPVTPAAVDAAVAIDRLKAAMGAGYPPPMPQQMLARAGQWLTARDSAKAKAEFSAMVPLLGGTERDQATVRLGAADLLSGNAAPAYRYLAGLHIPHSEADAERLYYMEEAARKSGDDAGANEAFRQLEKNYSDSPWRLKALLAAGNSYAGLKEPEKYTPLFKAAYEKFPEDVSTAACHWKVTWDAYLQRSPEAAELLKDQVARYPADSRAAGALYFLARLAVNDRSPAIARAYYEKLQELFPHYYYGVLAADRLAEKDIASVHPASEIIQWLNTVAFPERPDLMNDLPSAATKAHIERARLLASAGFADLAEFELRFGANTDGQRHLLAIELARSGETVARSLRHMKALTPEYLLLTYDRAPSEFWGYLFPLPFKEALLENAKKQNLDPYLVAGLIRQESEFNPGAVSRARALGLTQLLPSTGRMMARQESVPGFSTGMLLDPEVSLKLGTSYLRAQLDKWNGSLEQTLAAYNAGPGRVQQWLAGATFREPAEFVESIPFNETREYVQSVLRNAVVYRQLYTSAKPPAAPLNAVTSVHGDAPSTVAAGQKSARRPVKRKRTG